MTIFKDFTELKAAVGQALEPTPYITITQEMINSFAESTLDNQWIHVDVEKAKAGPFKTPIAHGFLVLSLASKFATELFKVESMKMGINYGLNKVRFTGVVPVNSRVRLKANIKSIENYHENGVKIEIDGVIELEGASKPVVVLEWIVLEFQ
jgi:acyl dehydratase